MRSARAVLSIRYTRAAADAGRAVSGFLRYVQHRDHSNVDDRDRGIAGLVRYVAYRDAASPEGRLFGPDGKAGSRERRELVRYVRCSLASYREGGRPGRSVYRLVLSPEDARGLDLRQMARSTMAQLERDTGAKLPPWIAAEHRNTEHPHVHIVMAARREVAPGRFREVRVTRPRLARMKVALAFELEQQRGSRQPHRSLEQRLLEAARPRNEGRQWEGKRWQVRIRFSRGGVQRFFARYAAQQRREAERLARQQELERDNGWER